MGKYIIIPKAENSKPPILATARLNQNGSSFPPSKKGIIPNMVDSMVNAIGVILLVKAFRYSVIEFSNGNSFR